MQCTLLQCASVPVTPHCRQCLMLLVLFISALDNMYILKVPKPKPPDPVPSPELHTFICYCLLSVFAWILFTHFSNSTSLAEDFIGPVWPSAIQSVSSSSNKLPKAKFLMLFSQRPLFLPPLRLGGLHLCSASCIGVPPLPSPPPLCQFCLHYLLPRLL